MHNAIISQNNKKYIVNWHVELLPTNLNNEIKEEEIRIWNN